MHQFVESHRLYKKKLIAKVVLLILMIKPHRNNFDKLKLIY